jgi:hypothetical protein
LIFGWRVASVGEVGAMTFGEIDYWFARGKAIFGTKVNGR